MVVVVTIVYILCCVSCVFDSVRSDKRKRKDMFRDSSTIRKASIMAPVLFVCVCVCCGALLLMVIAESTAFCSASSNYIK